MRDERLVARVRQATSSDLEAILMLRDRYRWPLTRIAKHWETTPEALVRQLTPPEPGDIVVICGRCGWRTQRIRPTATLRPCYRCGARMHPSGRPRRVATLAERRGVDRLVCLRVYVLPETDALLRTADEGVAGCLSVRGAIAGAVLDRWAQGLQIPAGWDPPIREPHECKKHTLPSEDGYDTAFGASAHIRHLTPPPTPSQAIGMPETTDPKDGREPNQPNPGPPKPGDAAWSDPVPGQVQPPPVTGPTPAAPANPRVDDPRRQQQQQAPQRGPSAPQVQPPAQPQDGQDDQRRHR